MVNVILMGTLFDIMTPCSLVDIQNHKILKFLFAEVTDI